MLQPKHQVHYHHQGDFILDERVVIEVGGKSKDSKQIEGLENAYLALDDIEFGYGNAVPL